MAPKGLKIPGAERRQHMSAAPGGLCASTLPSRRPMCARNGGQHRATAPGPQQGVVPRRWRPAGSQQRAGQGRPRRPHPGDPAVTPACPGWAGFAASVPVTKEGHPRSCGQLGCGKGGRLCSVRGCVSPNYPCFQKLLFCLY